MPPDLDFSSLAPKTPTLRPTAGFCMKGKIISAGAERSAMAGASLYMNFTHHKLIERPKNPSGGEVDENWVLRHGLGNMRVPLDLGSFRKQKLSHEGKATAFICDVVFHPLLIQLFMDDEFNSKQSNNDPRLTFRPYLGNVAFNMIERELKIKLSRAEKDIKLVKECRYKDPEAGGQPREFQEVMTEEAMEEVKKELAAQLKREKITKEDIKFTAPPDGLPTHAGLAGLNASGPSASSSSADATDDNENNFTIREHVVKKPVMKKGFFNSEKAKKGVLYGEAGSGEGVLPENAGDPLGYIPKKLRQTCKIIDTNTPE